VQRAILEVWRNLWCLFAVSLCFGQQTPAEKDIAAGHWKRARAIVEPEIRQSPDDPEANFLLSQIRAAFGDRTAPLRLAEKAVALDGRAAKYHRQVAEVLGVVAQHSNPFQQLLLARRFRKEIDTALALDPRDVQAHRDLLEFYLLAPGVAGGSRRDAGAVAERIATLDAPEGFLAQARLAASDKDSARQLAMLRAAAAASPPSYRARIALAELDPRAAEDAIRLDPGRSDAYAILAGTYAGRGEYRKLDAILAEAARAVPDDRYPEYRAAERLIAAGQNFDRAESYLRDYLAQEPEGNRPTAADARQLLRRLHAAEASR
jgi:tetratricopeptide (TPR) repeat protein